MNEEDLLISLLKDALNGDEVAFRHLYELTHKKVFHFIYRLINDQYTAEDILTNTYVEVWLSLKKFKGHSKVLTWIMGIARNLAMNELRRHKIEYELDDVIASPPTQFCDYADAERAEILQESINRLPLKHREILDLVFLQGMSYEDISQVIGIPVNTVKTRIFYAKDKLKNILKSMGYTKDDFI